MKNIFYIQVSSTVYYMILHWALYLRDISYALAGYIQNWMLVFSSDIYTFVYFAVFVNPYKYQNKKMSKYQMPFKTFGIFVNPYKYQNKTNEISDKNTYSHFKHLVFLSTHTNTKIKQMSKYLTKTAILNIWYFCQPIQIPK